MNESHDQLTAPATASKEGSLSTLKFALGYGCFASALLPGFLTFGTSMAFDFNPFSLLFLLYAAGLVRVGWVLVKQRNSPFSKLKWAMILVTILACIYPSAFFFWHMTHFRKATPPCKVNLQNIEHAKKIWATEEEKSTNDVPAWEDIRKEINGSKLPVCPEGGTYSLGRVGESPVCSIGGPRHTLHYDPGFPWALVTIAALFFLSAGLQLIVGCQKNFSEQGRTVP